MVQRGRRAPQEFVADISVPNDGLRVRDSQPWARDKLGIVWAYAKQYAVACKNSSVGFYFVDGMAGPGICRIEDEEGEHYLLGSTLIALKTEPAFTRTLAMDIQQANVDALMARTEGLRDRAVIRRGDCNSDLLPAMREVIDDRRAPSFVLLDPEGAELHWKTVQEIASFRQGARKSEVLLLLATSFLDRMLPRAGDIEPHNISALNSVFPVAGSWERVWDRRRRDEISAEEGRAEYAESYATWLRQHLGYAFVETRSITRPLSPASVYHLIFASDHPAGERIMQYVFSTMYPNQRNLRLPGFEA